jgi:hypothetical protein
MNMGRYLPLRRVLPYFTGFLADQNVWSDYSGLSAAVCLCFAGRGEGIKRCKFNDDTSAIMQRWTEGSQDFTSY